MLQKGCGFLFCTIIMCFRRLCKRMDRSTSSVKPEIRCGSRLYDFGNDEYIQLRPGVFGTHFLVSLQADKIARLSFTSSGYYIVVNGKHHIMVDVLSSKKDDNNNNNMGKKVLRFRANVLDEDEMDMALRTVLGLFAAQTAI